MLMLASLADKVVREPANLECRRHGRDTALDSAGKWRNLLASPLGFERNSGIILVASSGTLAPRAPRSNAQGLDHSVSK
jgi:hypothetical protein